MAMDRDEQIPNFNYYKGQLHQRGLTFKPFYDDTSDYNTNAKSYYDYLGRFNGFLSTLVDFVNDLALRVGKYNHNSYYLNIVTLDAVGDNKTDNTPLFESFNNNQMYYVPRGIYRTQHLPDGYFFGEGIIKYYNEEIHLVKHVAQRVRVNLDKSTEERYQSYISGQNAGTKLSDYTYANTGIGYSVLKENKDGRRLTGFGKGSLSNLINGYSNVVMGADALGQGEYGQRNVGIGDNALKWGGTTDVHKTLHDFWKDKGSQNFIESYFRPKYERIWEILGSETNPSSDILPSSDNDFKENIGIGRNALVHLMKGQNNVAIGYNSQAHTMKGNGNTSVGDRSLRDNVAGNRNSAFGEYALTNNITGEDNVAFGGNVLQQTLHASNNTAIGYGAMHFFDDDKNKNNEDTYTQGYRNTAIGTQTMQDGKNASYSTFLGSYAGRYVEGDYNVGLGASSMYNLTTGQQNVGVGGNTNREVVTGSDNIAIGYTAGPTGDFTNTVSLGGNAHALGNNEVQLGDDSQTVYTHNALQQRSDERSKKDIKETKLGLDFIKQLKPVDYKYKNSDKQQHGLIAQDIVSLNSEFGGVTNHKENGGEDLYNVAYTELIAPLIKSVQELSQEVEELKKELGR